MMLRKRVSRKVPGWSDDSGRQAAVPSSLEGFRGGVLSRSLGASAAGGRPARVLSPITITITITTITITHSRHIHNPHSLTTTNRRAQKQVQRASISDQMYSASISRV
jgi:hypothetical protein